MKKIIAGTVIFAALSALTAFGADEGITLNIDGEELECDVAPQIIDGRTMVPVRAIFEAVGAEVSYESETKTVTAVKDGTTVVMVIDSTIEEINGEQTEMDTAPVIIEGRTLAPARYVAEAFGCEVLWNGDTKTVDITTPSETEAVTETETEAETDEATEATTETSEIYGYFDLSFFRENTFASELQPVDYSGVSSENAAVHEELRSEFEQTYLYYQMMINSDTLTSKLKNEDYEAVVNFIHSCWDANLYFYAFHLLEDEYKEDEYDEILPTDIPEEVMNDCIESIEADCKLYSDDNMGIIIEGTGGGRGLILIEMAEDEYEDSCLYIAVAFNGEGGISFYTLEKTSGDSCNVCEKTENGAQYIDELETVSTVITTLDKDDDDLKMSFLYAVCDDYF